MELKSKTLFCDLDYIIQSMNYLMPDNLYNPIHKWYLQYSRQIAGLEVIYPRNDEADLYIRNKMYSSKFCDVFIHAMCPGGSTLIHSHGLNDVFIVALSQNVRFYDFQLNTVDDKSFKIKILADDAFICGDLYHKPAPDDLVHQVYNPNKMAVSFLEVYVKPYSAMPIFLLSYNKDMAINLKLNNPKFKISQPIYFQLRNEISELKSMTMLELLSLFKQNTPEFCILLEDDLVITDYVTLNDFLYQFNPDQEFYMGGYQKFLLLETKRNDENK